MLTNPTGSSKQEEEKTASPPPPVPDKPREPAYIDIHGKLEELALPLISKRIYGNTDSYGKIYRVPLGGS